MGLQERRQSERNESLLEFSRCGRPSLSIFITEQLMTKTYYPAVRRAAVICAWEVWAVMARIGKK